MAHERRAGAAPADDDASAGFDVQPDFERFSQRDDVFRRSWWDARQEGVAALETIGDTTGFRETPVML